MSVSVTYASNLTVAEILETNADLLNDKTVSHQLNTSATAQGSGSTPPCTTVASGDIALSIGAVTIDLTALSGVNAAVIDGSGLKVQFIKLRNKATNANVMTFAIGASNGYDGFGDDFSITLAPGAEVLLRTQDGGNNIASDNKTLDVTGTGSQVIEWVVVMG